MFCVWSGPKVCMLCRSRRVEKHEPFLASIGVDTAEIRPGAKLVSGVPVPLEAEAAQREAERRRAELAAREESLVATIADLEKRLTEVEVFLKKGNYVSIVF